MVYVFCPNGERIEMAVESVQEVMSFFCSDLKFGFVKISSNSLWKNGQVWNVIDDRKL